MHRLKCFACTEARARVQTAATLLAIPVAQAGPAEVAAISAASNPERNAVGRRRLALQLLAGAVGLGTIIGLTFVARPVYRRQPERAWAASSHEPVASPPASSKSEVSHTTAPPVKSMMAVAC
jgi:hypothetical protein